MKSVRSRAKAGPVSVALVSRHLLRGARRRGVTGSNNPLESKNDAVISKYVNRVLKTGRSFVSVAETAILPEPAVGTGAAAGGPTLSDLGTALIRWLRDPRRDLTPIIEDVHALHRHQCTEACAFTVYGELAVCHASGSVHYCTERTCHMVRDRSAYRRVCPITAREFAEVRLDARPARLFADSAGGSSYHAVKQLDPAEAKALEFRGLRGANDRYARNLCTHVIHQTCFSAHRHMLNAQKRRKALDDTLAATRRQAMISAVRGEQVRYQALHLICAEHTVPVVDNNAWCDVRAEEADAVRATALLCDMVCWYWYQLSGAAEVSIIAADDDANETEKTAGSGTAAMPRFQLFALVILMLARQGIKADRGDVTLLPRVPLLERLVPSVKGLVQLGLDPSWFARANKFNDTERWLRRALCEAHARGTLTPFRLVGCPM